MPVPGHLLALLSRGEARFVGNLPPLLPPSSVMVRFTAGGALCQSNAQGQKRLCVKKCGVPTPGLGPGARPRTPHSPVAVSSSEQSWPFRYSMAVTLVYRGFPLWK